MKEDNIKAEIVKTQQEMTQVRFLYFFIASYDRQLSADSKKKKKYYVYFLIR